MPVPHRQSHLEERRETQRWLLATRAVLVTLSAYVKA